MVAEIQVYGVSEMLWDFNQFFAHMFIDLNQTDSIACVVRR